MKKHSYLGVHDMDHVCLLYSLADFDTLKANIDTIERSDFQHDATSWCGSDSMDRTCRIESVVPTGRKIKLKKPIIFTGIDHDHGHEYRWMFGVDEIWECMVR